MGSNKKMFPRMTGEKYLRHRAYMVKVPHPLIRAIIKNVYKKFDSLIQPNIPF